MSDQDELYKQGKQKSYDIAEGFFVCREQFLKQGMPAHIWRGLVPEVLESIFDELYCTIIYLDDRVSELEKQLIEKEKK